MRDDGKARESDRIHPPPSNSPRGSDDGLPYAPVTLRRSWQRDAACNDSMSANTGRGSKERNTSGDDKKPDSNGLWISEDREETRDEESCTRNRGD